MNDPRYTPEFCEKMTDFCSYGCSNKEVLSLAAIFVCAHFGQVSADDLRIVELITEDADKRIYGSTLGYLKKRNILTTVGFKSTNQKTSNSRPISVFALTPKWRGNWMASDSLPVPRLLVDLKTNFTEDDGGQQIPQEEIFELLRKINLLARDGLEACVTGTTDTQVWLKMIETETNKWRT